MLKKLDAGIYTIEEGVTQEHCRELIQMAEGLGFVEAPIGTMAHTMTLKGIRNNARIIWDNPAFAKRFWELLAPYSLPSYFGAKPIGVNERFRLYRYRVGEKFDWHADGAFRRDNGEQSVYTVLLYLSDDFEGGETLFKNTKVIPKEGSICIFEHKKLHKGAEVRKGVKYVLRTDVMVSKPLWK